MRAHGPSIACVTSALAPGLTRGYIREAISVTTRSTTCQVVLALQPTHLLRVMRNALVEKLRKKMEVEREASLCELCFTLTQWTLFVDDSRCCFWQ